MTTTTRIEKAVWLKLPKHAQYRSRVKVQGFHVSGPHGDYVIPTLGTSGLLEDFEYNDAEITKILKASGRWIDL